ncbi:hypothetical protein CASFOL_039072 [Castilleja foliolosa]|uniref:Uncharacterized protein n=1 Tax=Castilleja foliolosa TaxID=1961234 RepID=A0ABD3BGZ6_9LAMI
MELKRSASSPSNETNPKRRATPVEDSPLAQLFNDAGIQALARILVNNPLHDKLVQSGKDFLKSLQVIMNNSPQESANDIYEEACHVWVYDYRSLMSACTYAIDEERSLSDKLLFYTNDDPPAERMASMMKDPWLKYILGLEQSDFVRGFLSILIAYWNVKELLYKYKVAQYRRTPAPEYIPPVNEKIEHVTYVIKHFEDFQNLREVLESMYCDPALVDSLFEQISHFQVGEMNLAKMWTPQDRAIIGDRPLMIRVAVRSVEFKPFSLFKVFSVRALPSNYII